jgi:hypothetical protein
MPQVTPHLTQLQESSTPLSQTTGSTLSEGPAQQEQEQTAQSQPTEWQQQQQQQEQATGPVLSPPEQQQEQATGPVLSPPEQQQQQIQPHSDIESSTSSTSSNMIPLLLNSQNETQVQPEPLPTTSLALPPSQASLYPDNDNNGKNNAYDYNNTSNANNAGNGASNSTPQSTIKVTSIDRSTEPTYPDLTISMSNSTKQQYQSDGREQLQQRIQEIMNEFNSVNRNDGASLPTYIERN